MNHTRMIITVLLLCFFSLLFTGCQTANGFGKDVEDLGGSIQHEANK